MKKAKIIQILVIHFILPNNLQKKYYQDLNILLHPNLIMSKNNHTNLHNRYLVQKAKNLNLNLIMIKIVNQKDLQLKVILRVHIKQVKLI